MTPYTRLVAHGIIGDLLDPYEIFSFSMALDHPGDFLTNAQMDNCADAVEAFFGASGTKITNRATLTEVRFHHLDNTWHQDQPTYVVGKSQAGASSAGQRPSQVALAVSLRGPAAVHPARGRFYIPMPDHTLDTASGLLSSTEVQTTANLAVTLSNDLYEAMGSLGQLGIATKGDVVPAEQIRVGRVLDTIRSRRNQPLESYRVGILVP